MEIRDAKQDRTAATGTARAAVRWAAALAVAGLALTGCGVGQNAQTADKEPAVDGVNVDQGDLSLRDLQVDFGDSGRYPRGGSAPLQVWISNQGEQAVVLESVTSPDAEAVTLASGTPSDGSSQSPSESPSPSEEDSARPDPEAGEPTDGGEIATEEEDPSATPSADIRENPEGDESVSPSTDVTSAPAGDDASATAGASETPGGGEGGQSDFTIEIAPGSHERLSPGDGPFLVLEGLKEELDMGSTVEVVFTFSNGEEVTAHLPVGEPGEAPSRSYFEAPHEGHGE